MLLLQQQRRTVRAAAVGPLPAPGFAPGQGARTTVPNAPRPSGRPAEQYDFGTVGLQQDDRWPIVSRYGDGRVQRQAQPRPFRSYPDLYAGYDYPSVVTTAQTPTRGGVRATQTDFSIRKEKVSGRRWNGLLLGLPLNTITFRVPGNTTYQQAVGYALRWASGLFPTQFSGLRYFSGTVKELCLVAVADAPTGMGGAVEVSKNGVTYAVYLVETSDPNASGVRITTTTGTKAARLKT